MKQKQPWIGFVHVQPKGGVNPLGEGLKGAFAHALALAVDSESYEELIRTALEEAGLQAVEFQDVSPVDEYRREDRISDDMEDLIASLSAEHPVQFDTFDAYRGHDA